MDEFHFDDDDSDYKNEENLDSDFGGKKFDLRKSIKNFLGNNKEVSNLDLDDADVAEEFCDDKKLVKEE
eukprot:CAMPEP_0117053188 /NCGR_PEP_ID=MMETSP0472-20121206/36781_1 /TAXON_ID=693140 ORGANISM="Tiarina fusus, Strain LIS" /NCGR_SAMPLE_ID=MMETSP0472 /ASSEMBLY_ACC=CAM_ASM_000603 /LENGTH=68 /DNA_ID=CAMNT_0004768133 /DNA_START=568 /DNA_END=771 /DNA_ORIENTATION=-